MRIALVGSTGTIGRATAELLGFRGHEVVGLSRSTTPALDITDPDSVAPARAAGAEAGPLDAVVSTTGGGPFRPLPELTVDDFRATLAYKALGQIAVAQQALALLRGRVAERVAQQDAAGAGRFSVTLTSGVLSRLAVPTGVAAAAANGAVEAYVRTAAGLSGGVRINAVSPSVVTESLYDPAGEPNYAPFFPGIPSVPVARVAEAVVRSVEGAETGQVIEVV
jgi:NAD(P)-dependent dehydrogenase (short-subunit alcohol dehydrogenase family)